MPLSSGINDGVTAECIAAWRLSLGAADFAPRSPGSGAFFASASRITLPVLKNSNRLDFYPINALTSKPLLPRSGLWAAPGAASAIVAGAVEASHGAVLGRLDAVSPAFFRNR